MTHLLDLRNGMIDTDFIQKMDLFGAGQPGERRFDRLRLLPRCKYFVHVPQPA